MKSFCWVLKGMNDLCLSVILDTKQAPQSWIGRFKKVIGWGVSRYYCCSEVDWVWIDEKGCWRVDERLLMRVGIEQRLVVIKRGYEWLVMMMSDDDEWWWGVGASASTKDWTQVLVMGLIDLEKGFGIYRGVNSLVVNEPVRPRSWPELKPKSLVKGLWKGLLMV